MGPGDLWGPGGGGRGPASTGGEREGGAGGGGIWARGEKRLGGCAGGKRDGCMEFHTQAEKLYGLCGVHGPNEMGCS